MEVVMTMARQVRKPTRLTLDAAVASEFGEEFADIFDESNTMAVEFEAAGMPTEIALLPPSSMPGVRIDPGDLFDRTLKVEYAGVPLPDSIKIYGPDTPLPTSISIDGMPEEVDLVYRGGPIPVDASAVPQIIRLVPDKAIPERIIVEQLRPLPDRIAVEYVGPTTLTLEPPPPIPILVPEGVGLPVIFPEKMPELEVVWKGAPIEVKVTMDDILPRNREGRNCVMITPCVST